MTNATGSSRKPELVFPGIVTFLAFHKHCLHNTVQKKKSKPVEGQQQQNYTGGMK